MDWIAGRKCDVISARIPLDNQWPDLNAEKNGKTLPYHVFYTKKLVNQLKPFIYINKCGEKDENPRVWYLNWL